MKDALELKKVKNKASVVIFLTVLIMITMIMYNFSETSYALKNYSITFWRAEGTEIMKTCTSDVNGKLTEECLQEIEKVCSRWSLDKCQHSGCDGDNQSNPKTIDQLREITFEKDTYYYCKGGTSQSGYSKGCYICKADEDIVKWGFSTDGDLNCPGGYRKDSSKTESECVVNACYICKNNERVMKWSSSNISDDNCPSGYDKTNKSESECVYIAPPEDACYVCSTDESVIKWSTDGDADSNCPSGYNKTNKSESNCKYIENPKTGSYEYIYISILVLTTAILLLIEFYPRKNAIK